MSSDDIQYGVPIPDAGGSYFRRFSRMLAGGSFAMNLRSYGSLRASASRYKRAHPGWDYETHIVDGEVRLWCTSLPKQESQ